MIRILFLLVTFISFSIMAKPEKDFQLYCEEGLKHAVFSYKDEGGAPTIKRYELSIEGHTIEKWGYESRNLYSWSRGEYVKPHYQHFQLVYSEHLIKKMDEFRYYFGGLGTTSWKYELDRRSLRIENKKNYGDYKCSLINKLEADETVKRWEEWRKEWRLKYPIVKNKPKI